MSGPLFVELSSMQPELAPGTSAPSGSAAKPAPESSGSRGLGGWEAFLMPALIMVVFYLFLLRPQAKRQKESDALLKSLKKGQKVRTSSGIRGEIIDFKEESGDEVVLRVAEGVKLNILRSHIAGVVGEGEAKKA